eukprot:891692-Amphidinium_carterae.3
MHPHPVSSRAAEEHPDAPSAGRQRVKIVHRGAVTLQRPPTETTIQQRWTLWHDPVWVDATDGEIFHMETVEKGVTDPEKLGEELLALFRKSRLKEEKSVLPILRPLTESEACRVGEGAS